MSRNQRFNRRGLLFGAAGLAAAELSGFRARPALAQSTQGVTDTEILIGALGQVSGPFGFIGVSSRDNMQMAIDRLNGASGVNGRKLRLLFENASTPSESLAAAKKLIEDDKVFALLIATGNTGAAVAAADYVRAVKIPTYNTVSAAPIGEPFTRNIFHGAVPSTRMISEALVDIGFKAFQSWIDAGFKSVPKASRVGVLAGTYAFPQSQLAEIKSRLETSGLEVVIEQFDASATDYTAQLITLASHQVELVFILGSFKEAGVAMNQAREKGLTDVLFVVDGSAVDNAIIPIVGADKTNNIWGYFNAPYFPTQNEPPIADYRRVLIEKYGGALPHGRPNIYDLISYGSIYILAKVLRKAGRDLTWDRMISAWETLNDAKPSDMGGYDVIFPETVTPTDHQGNKKVGAARIINSSWHVVNL